MIPRTLEELLTDVRGRVVRLERRLNKIGAGGGSGGIDFTVGAGLDMSGTNVLSVEPQLAPDLPTMPPATDLNNVKNTGWYIQRLSADATLALNYPVNRAGHLEVSGGLMGTGADLFKQTYTEYAPVAPSTVSRTWMRTHYNGTWTPWTLVAEASGALPPPIRYQETGVVTVAATAWGTLLPGYTPPTMTVDRPLWVLVTIGMWMQASAGDTRAGLALSGATVMSPPNIPQDGGSVTTWGQVAQAGATDFTAAGGSGQRTIQRLVKINPGTTSFRLEAYMATAGTHQVNYQVTEIIPLYYDGTTSAAVPTLAALTKRYHTLSLPWPDVETTLDWDSAGDTAGHFSWDSATKEFVCLIPGTYDLVCSMGSGQTAPPNYMRFTLYHNGTVFLQALGDRQAAGGRTVNGAVHRVLNAGDRIRTSVVAQAATSTVSNDPARTFIELTPVVTTVETVDQTAIRGQVAGMKMCSGSYTISGSVAIDGNHSQAITFPAGFFSSPPVLVSAMPNNGRVTPQVSGVVATGCTIGMNNWSSGAMPAGTVVLWAAWGVGP